MKKYTYTAFFVALFFTVLIIVTCSIYKINISPVSKDSALKTIEIAKGETYLSIASKLKDNNLIKSEFYYKLYVKLMNPKGLEEGFYYLSEDMGVEKIIKVLSDGSDINANTINITFLEGKNMRSVAKVISENTNNTEDDVYNLLNDTTYLDALIDKYWFLTDEIKDSRIYYSLEGYLFPDTYQFKNKDVTVKEIFETLLDELDNKLTPYKNEISNSNYTVHQLLTLASIIELEGVNVSDRFDVSGVFYNRLNAGWSLGSDVTTYYASKVDMNERDLYKSEINECNSYNTRNSCMAGKLPVGPVSNPSIESIEAAIRPNEHNYYYFVADKNKKTYFTKTNAEHLQTIASLKSQGLWYEYQN